MFRISTQSRGNGSGGTHSPAAEPSAIVVEFPLRGEWVAVNTPAERIPSHGTDMLGQRYAYDFLRIERAARGFKFFRGSRLRYLAVGVRLADCYGWAAPIFAPFAGTVVAARDGWPERRRLHFLRDLAIVIKNSLLFDPKRAGDLRAVLGNYIILKMRDREVFGFFAHARSGSLRVREGDEVATGAQLAEVGHSGNSSAPHLHVQLMDRADILAAQGLPCEFQGYEALHDGAWVGVPRGTPGKREFVRYAATAGA
jgi:hypothetical protein